MSESASKRMRESLGDQEKEKWSLVVFTAIVFFGVLLNLRVLFIIVEMPKLKRHRPASILVGHLSAVAIAFAFICLTILADRVDFINLGRMRMCEVTAYFKTVIFHTFSLNLTAIIYERIRTFRENLGSLLVLRMISIIWLVSLLVSIPASFMNESEKILSRRRRINIGSCKSVPLFESVTATVIYESARLILFHFAVVGYKIHALLRIRSKLKYLYILKPIPNERMRRKVHSIRFVYVHFLTFILIWLPVGLLVFAHRTLSRILVNYMSERKNNQESPAATTLNRCFGFLIFIYFILNPMIYLLLIENAIWPKCCKIRKHSNPLNELETQQHTSRVSTVAVTSDTNSNSKAYGKIPGNKTMSKGTGILRFESSSMSSLCLPLLFKESEPEGITNIENTFHINERNPELYGETMV